MESVFTNIDFAHVQKKLRASDVGHVPEDKASQSDSKKLPVGSHITENIGWQQVESRQGSCLAE